MTLLAQGDEVVPSNVSLVQVEMVHRQRVPAARVVWMGMGSDSQALLNLQGDLEAQLDQAGWPPEARRFSGHLTLARVKQSRAGLALARALATFKDLNLGSIPVDKVTVYQSQLRPQGPLYTALAKYHLT